MKGAFPTGTDTGGSPIRFVPPKIEELVAKFPQLEILEFIGQGGMGAVYKARQKQLDRVVALKILPPQVATGPGFAERFAHEARALAKLNHPHIVTLYEFGQADGLFYFLMEFVDGLNLGHLLRDRKLAPNEALAIVPQICDALQYAHEHGIVHRDIKPENILLSKEGQVKIADFGVAKIVAQGLEEAAGTTPAPAGELTQAGSALGTPQYMAPEQIKNSAEVDHRADIYSLGVVFYQMLTGELPEGKIEPPSKKVQVDVRLDEVVLRALEKKPEMRYQEASVLKTQVETIAQMPGGGAYNVDSFQRAVLARDYPLNISNCLNRGWNLLTSDFWPIVGVCALIWLISKVANSSIVGIIIGAPVAGGLWVYFLNRIRGLPATLETAFSGFKIAFLQLVLAGVVTKALTLLGFLLILPGIFLWVAWMFTLPLVVDKGLDFWSAMETSRKIITRHWWKFFWFFIVLLLIHVVGVACCYVGMFVAIPLCLAALAYAYEDVVGPIPPVPAGAPARSGSSSGASVGVVLGVAAAVVVFIVLLGLLVGLVVPAFQTSRLRHISMHERQNYERDSQQPSARALERPVGRSDYIGQAYFPYGDYIRITSVGRSHDRMTVKGVYTLVSTDSATLALQMTTTNTEAEPNEVSVPISKGSGNFTLSRSLRDPGLPHLNMFSTNAENPFAELYFGTEDEAREETHLNLRPPPLSYQWMANSTNLPSNPSSSQQELCVGNLRLIDAAKQQWALEHNKTGADVPTWEDLAPYLSGDSGTIKVFNCPSGGIYTLGPMSNKPTCSIPGHALP